MQRPGREGLLRNAAAVLANAPSDRGRGALLEALATDPSPRVRAAAARALARAHGADFGVRERLGAALARERDPAARRALEGALAT